jgi:hypothetical protein
LSQANVSDEPLHFFCYGLPVAAINVDRVPNRGRFWLERHLGACRWQVGRIEIVFAH